MDKFTNFSLKNTAKKFPNLEIDELIKFHFVFDEFTINSQYSDIFEAIKFEILYKFTNLQNYFYFDSLNANEIKIALMKFAKSDRKKLGISKILPRFKAQKIVDELLKINFLILEKSKEEKPKKNHKNDKLPKNLRHYKVQDKVHFRSNFSRFWFRFIQPNLTFLQNGKFDKVLQIIKQDFDNYSSLAYENLCKEFLQIYLNIGEISSFWTKDIEIDIFYKFENFCLVGECKYKDRKICKNVLNLLEQKCEKLCISPNLITLFSKSGFSNDLLNLQNSQILLFDLKDFDKFINL